jgi:hypothetical protein
MPSLTQIQELVDNCAYTWTIQNGVWGGKFTGPNGGTVFLPTAGRAWDGGGDGWDVELFGVGQGGFYWSSTPYGEIEVYWLFFNDGGAGWSIAYGSDGRSVRPVR